jgi:Spy/CpxP family protein refolding chaperone
MLKDRTSVDNRKGEIKIMKTKIAILVAIGALIVGGVVLATAQGGPPQGQGPPPPPPPFGVPDIEHLTRALSLTDAQANELKPFLDTERTLVDSLRQKMDDLHKQIEAATKDGHFDEAQVRTLAGQQAQTMTDMIVEQERIKAKIYNTLTADQRAKLMQMHQRHGHGPGGPGGPGGPPPPPPDK